MSRLTRDGTAEPVSRDQILRHARGQGNIISPVQLTTSRIGNLTRLIHTLLNVITIHTYIPAWKDQCEWHRMTRMIGSDCAVMCTLINIHTYNDCVCVCIYYVVCVCVFIMRFVCVYLGVCVLGSQ